MAEPVDIGSSLADPETYEDVILSIFDKRRQRGLAFTDVEPGVTYFATAAGRRTLSKAIARSVAAGRYQPEPVDLWFLESRGKTRAAHRATFTDQVLGAALYRLLTRNAASYGLPGVYSYLPGLTNTTAMRALAAFVRAHRKRSGATGPPMYVLQSDFAHYGDGLPVGPDAALWPILREVAGLGSANGVVPDNVWELIVALIRPVVRDGDGALFTRLHGVAMGTPLVPLISNLAVVPMDRAVLGVDGIFYARYNDDFLLAHPDLDALREADARIDTVFGRSGGQTQGGQGDQDRPERHGYARAAGSRLSRWQPDRLSGPVGQPRRHRQRRSAPAAALPGQGVRADRRSLRIPG